MIGIRRKGEKKFKTRFESSALKVDEVLPGTAKRYSKSFPMEYVVDDSTTSG
jgi:hypothetical protein